MTQRWASRTGEAAPSSGQGMRTEPWAPPFITDQGLIKPKPHSELLTPQATRLSPTRLSLGQGDWRGRDKGGTPPHHGIKVYEPLSSAESPAAGSQRRDRAGKQVTPGQALAAFLLRCLEPRNQSLWLTLTCTLLGPSHFLEWKDLDFLKPGPLPGSFILPVTDRLGDLEPVTFSL